MSKEKFVVIGAGHFGSAIAIALSQKGAEVLVIDSVLSVIQDIADDVAYAVCVDSTNKRALMAENIQDFDTVIVAIGNDFEARLLCVSNLLDLKVKRIICRTLGKNQQKILEKMGVTEFLSPENEIGTLVAERLMTPEILSCLQLPDEYQIAEIVAPHSLIGSKIGDVGLRDNYRLSLITIQRMFEELHNNRTNAGKHIIGVPDNAEIIMTEDVFVLFGKSVDIENFIKVNQ